MDEELTSTDTDQEVVVASLGAGGSARTRTSGITPSISYRIATSRTDLEAAYRLVHQQYTRRGYIEEHPSGLWLSIHNALPETTTFIATLRYGEGQQKLLGTVTLVPDSPLGFPMDTIYRAELDRLRSAGRRIGEVTMLASHIDAAPLEGSGRLAIDRCRVFFTLFRLVFREASARFGLDDLCIAIHPTHSLLYDQIGFQDFAPLVSYCRVNGNPALGKRVDLHTVRVRLALGKRPAIYRVFFGQVSALVLDRPKFVMTPEDLAYFCLDQTELLPQASQSVVEYLISRYRLYHSTKSILA